MNRITKKLFLYFTIVAVFLAATVFVGFYGTFRYYSLQHHKMELRTRAETIEEKLGTYINNCAQNQELSAYLKVLDDISLADAYFIGRNKEFFTCTCSCGTTVAVDKKPTEEVEAFADEIFITAEYTQKEVSVGDTTMIYVGVPLVEAGNVNAVVVIVDTFDFDQKSFLYAIGILFACLAVALGAAMFIASRLAKRFMLPIQKIAGTTKELANGNYHAKTEVEDNTEIGILAKETDILAERLASVEQMQKDYITSISHELRTPVAVIRSSVEALHDGMVPKEKIDEYHKQMLSETISLQRLVNDMLELSRLENEEFKLQKEEIDLLQVLEDAVRAARLMSREKNIMIHYESLTDEWLIEGDYGRLKQMFITVLDNAVKYSAPGRSVWITAKNKVKTYYISIEDEGCGIPKEEQKYIFDKFYRTSNAGSTGLGLVVMKNIAKRHDISVRLHSEEGKGTCLTFIVNAYKYSEKNDE